MPARHDFEVWIGNTRNFRLRLKDKTTGLAVNLTGITVYFTVPGLSITRTSLVGGGITLDGPNGEFSWQMSVSETRAMQIGVAQDYEIEFRKDGEQDTKLYGRLIPKGGNNAD